MRLVFHGYKPFRNVEAEAAKVLIGHQQAYYDVDFAFLQIGQDHEWVAYDPDSPGCTTPSRTVISPEACACQRHPPPPPGF